MTRRELPSDPLDLLRRVAEPLPPPGAEERVASLLFARGLALAPTMDATPHAPAVAPEANGSIGRSAKHFLRWSLLPLVVGIVIGASGKRYLASQPKSVASAAAPLVVASAPLVTEPAVTASVSSTVAAPAVTESAPRPAASNLLAQERAVLDQARKKLALSEPEVALRSLELHLRRFPRGALAEEREAMRVQVLVLLGRAAQAKHAGDAFRARFPNSLMSSSVEAALAAAPPTP